jgi:hypothetical protein
VANSHRKHVNLYNYYSILNSTKLYFIESSLKGLIKEPKLLKVTIFNFFNKEYIY